MKDYIIDQLTSYFTLIDYIMDNLVKAEWLKMGDNYGWYNTIFSYLIPIAVSLACVYFILELNKKWAIEGDDVTPQTLLVPFLKMFIFAMVVTHMGYLVENIQLFTDEIIDNFAPASTSFDLTEISAADLAEQIYNGSGKMSFVIIALYGLLVLVFSVLAVVMMLGFIYKAFCFKVEYYFRLGFTAIACADVFNGANSSSIKWLKNCMAFALYGVAFVMLPSLVLATAADIIAAEINVANDIKTYGENMLVGLKCMALYALAPAVALGLLSTAKRVTREVMG